MANQLRFAKFAKVFPRQNFALYGRCDSCASWDSCQLCTCVCTSGNKRLCIGQTETHNKILQLPVWLYIHLLNQTLVGFVLRTGPAWAHLPGTFFSDKSISHHQISVSSVKNPSGIIESTTHTDHRANG